MKITIMQPYLFPYIGYFQLINAVDTFVIYDDINYIKQGWINRNRILLNNQPFFLTFNLKGASSFKKINEIEINHNSKKLLKTINQAYSKSPFFDEVYGLIEKIIRHDTTNLSGFVTNSIIEISKFLEIGTKFEISSQINVGTEMKGQDRVIGICKYFDATEYVNAIGGKELYSKEDFANERIYLKFLKTDEIIYKQFDNEFHPFLSIIDVMMFNSIPTIINFLNKYILV